MHRCEAGTTVRGAIDLLKAKDAHGEAASTPLTFDPSPEEPNRSGDPGGSRDEGQVRSPTRGSGWGLGRGRGRGRRGGRGRGSGGGRGGR
jgi:hypothetical protein